MRNDFKWNKLGLLNHFQFVNQTKTVTVSPQMSNNQTPSLKSAVCIPDIRLILISQFASSLHNRFLCKYVKH